MQRQQDCHDPLRWLISVSLDRSAMSVYDQLLKRQRKLPFIATAVYAFVILLFCVAGYWRSPIMYAVLFLVVVGWLFSIAYLNSLMCCPRCKQQVLPWYGRGIPSPPIPRICRICGLDFATTETAE